MKGKKGSKSRNPRSKRNEERKEYRGYNRRESYDSEEKADRTQGVNDISWYSRNPNLLIAAGSFPFPYRPGMTLPLGSSTLPGTTTITQRSFNIPGVMSLDWVPSVGNSSTATDPASILAREIYAKVRSVYSGNLNADAPDFVVYLLCLDSIFSYLAWLKRCYRVMNAWTPENYVLPDGVLGACGLSAKTILNLRENRTEFWQIINELVLQSRKFTCPAVMDLFNRHYWMSDNVYTDSAEINSQFYLFNLRAVYQYAALPLADGSGNTGAGAKMVVMPTYADPADGNDLMPSDFYQFGRQLIDALSEWGDGYEISGYLMAAYRGAPTFMVDELPADQPFTPVYQEEVLAQIENSRTVPNFNNSSVDYSGFNVTQNPLTNAVVSNPSYVAAADSEDGVISGFGYTLPPILSIRSSTPTVADNTIASRLQATVLNVSGETSKTITVSCGSEVPIQWKVHNLPVKVGGLYNGVPVPQTPVYVVDTGVITGAQANAMIAGLAQYTTLDQFDWHPFVFIQYARINVGSSKATTSVMSVVGDTHNITVIAQEDLVNLHKICIYSELNAFSA